MQINGTITLFRSSLDWYLNDQRNKMERAIAGLSAQQLERLPDGFMDKYTVEPLVLHRDQAKYSVSEAAGRETPVAIAIPFSGSSVLWNCHPEAERIGDLTGDINLGHKYQLTVPTITFRNRMTEPDSAAVRAWAAPIVDLVNDAIQRQRPLVEAWTADLSDAAITALQTRRDAVARAAKLRNDLGEGI